VLACGGFEFDDDLKINHLKAWPIYFYGNPGNNGDGVRMAQEIGAGMWHMNQMVGRAIGHFSGVDVNFIIGLNPPGYLITDKYGERFANEYSQATLGHAFYYSLLLYDAERTEYPRIPCYWFFDSRRCKAGPLTYTELGAHAVGLYSWSPDNRAEIERGWIAEGSTIEGAAREAGIADPVAAARTATDYNRGCAAQRDRLGRPAETLVPLDSPPYYCVPLWPGGPNTSGGPRRNHRAEVLDSFGNMIPGLYAAGELGQAIGMLYPASGADISDALCFGQIAAETCAASST
jgi:succinate dehydrogenase/fumarate reductase flavoprotein subunit